MRFSLHPDDVIVIQHILKKSILGSWILDISNGIGMICWESVGLACNQLAFMESAGL